MDSTTLEIRFLSPEEMVDFFALLKKCIRSDEKPDFESGSLRPNGNGTKFSCRQMVVKSSKPSPQRRAFVFPVPLSTNPIGIVKHSINLV